MVFLITLHVVLFSSLLSADLFAILITFLICCSLVLLCWGRRYSSVVEYLFPCLMFQYSTFIGTSKDRHLSLLTTNPRLQSKTIRMTHKYIRAPGVHTGICRCFCGSVFREYHSPCDCNSWYYALCMDSLQICDICCFVLIAVLSTLKNWQRLCDPVFCFDMRRNGKMFHLWPGGIVIVFSDLFILAHKSFIFTDQQRRIGCFVKC